MKSVLERIRKERGLSPSFVANFLEISYRQFRRIELSEAGLSDERASRLAKIYNLEKEEIIKAYKDKR